MFLPARSQDGTVCERWAKTSTFGALHHRIEKRLIDLEHSAVDEQTRRVEEIDHRGDGDGEVIRGFGEVGGQVDFSGCYQGDDLVNGDRSPQPARGTPGQRTVA